MLTIEIYLLTKHITFIKEGKKVCEGFWSVDYDIMHYASYHHVHALVEAALNLPVSRIRLEC